MRFFKALHVSESMYFYFLIVEFINILHCIMSCGFTYSHEKSVLAERRDHDQGRDCQAGPLLQALQSQEACFVFLVAPKEGRV